MTEVGMILLFSAGEGGMYLIHRRLWCYRVHRMPVAHFKMFEKELAHSHNISVKFVISASRAMFRILI